MTNPPSFSPIQSVVGGFLLHISTSRLLATTGRVYGVSSIVDGAVLGDYKSWRWYTIGGMVVAPIVHKLIGTSGLWNVHGYADGSGSGGVRTVISGLLVGLGSKLGSGCTSGHFLCGMSRLSLRSFTAAMTFFSTAIITTYIFPLSTNLGTSSTPLSVATLPIPDDYPALVLIPIGLLTATHITPYLPQSIHSLYTFALSGFTFSTGLLISGMVSSTKTTNFMRIPFLFPSGEWDPSLAMIVLAGVIPNTIHYLLTIQNSPKPSLGLKGHENWSFPRGIASRMIDWKLLLGAIIFGIGWGLGGVCPGPSITKLGMVLGGQSDWMGLQWFLPSMLVGMYAARSLWSCTAFLGRLYSSE